MYIVCIDDMTYLPEHTFFCYRVRGSSHSILALLSLVLNQFQALELRDDDKKRLLGKGAGQLKQFVPEPVVAFVKRYNFYDQIYLPSDYI